MKNEGVTLDLRVSPQQKIEAMQIAHKKYGGNITDVLREAIDRIIARGGKCETNP